jgi:putative acetyltransferase
MITLANYRDHEEILQMWEESVRSTYDFFYEDSLGEIKSLLSRILHHVKVYTWRDNEGCIKAFTGVTAAKMEMLFIHPTFVRQNIGAQLTNFCIHSLNIDQVDVKDQKEGEIGFYAKINYRLGE